MSKALSQEIGELAILVELAIFHAQQRLRQTILAILDLGEEVTLDAVEATVDRRFRVTLRGDDAAILGADQHAAASTAVAAGALVPAYAVVLALGLRQNRFRNGDASGGSRRSYCVAL